MIQRLRNRHGGALLLWSLTGLALSLILVASYYPMIKQNLLIQNRIFQNQQAYNLSEAAANEGLWYANHGLYDLVNLYAPNTVPPGPALADLDQDGDIDKIPPLNSDATQAIEYPFHSQHGWVPPSGPGPLDTPLGWPDTQKTILGVSAGDGSEQVVGDYTIEVVDLSNPQPSITGTGYIPSMASSTSIFVSRVVLELDPTDFRYAAYADDYLWIDNQVTIDSYDNRVGNYGPGNQLETGHVGTNAINPPVGQVGFRISSASGVVKGKGFVTPGTQIDPDPMPSSRLTGGVQLQQTANLPHIQIPAGLLGMGYSSAPVGCGVTCTCVAGNCTIPAGRTWNCIGDTKVKSLDIRGTFAMWDNCNLLVDNTGGSQATQNLDINMAGQIVRRDATPVTPWVSKIYMRDTGFDFEGNGAWVDTANNKPASFQVYVTCTTAPCGTLSDSALRQVRPFYGSVYVESGDLDITRGEGSGGPADATYYGGFVSGGSLRVHGEAANTVAIHFDERLRYLGIDGQGRQVDSFHVKSWETRQTK